MRYNPWIEVNRAGQQPAAKPTPVVDFIDSINRHYINLQAQACCNAATKRYRVYPKRFFKRGGPAAERLLGAANRLCPDIRNGAMQRFCDQRHAGLAAGRLCAAPR